MKDPRDQKTLGSIPRSTSIYKPKNDFRHLLRKQKWNGQRKNSTPTALNVNLNSDNVTTVSGSQKKKERWDD